MNEPQTGEIWRHKENGNEYIFILIANKASEKWKDRAVYSNCETGAIYDRPLSDFMDKFEYTRTSGEFKISIPGGYLKGRKYG